MSKKSNNILVKSFNNSLIIDNKPFSYWLENIKEFYKVKGKINNDLWNEISKYENLSKEFIIKNNKKLNIKYLIQYQTFDNELIILFKNRIIRQIDWREASAEYNLPESIICRCKNLVKWVWICKYQKLSHDFIKEFEHDMVWDCICKNNKILFDKTFLKYMLNKTCESRVSKEYLLTRYYIYMLHLPEVINEIISIFIQID
jgi:hypothetical protein